ncbi:MAG: DNA recombination/repair protein RecA, partial [Muribaculaceae bacterium]
IVDLGVLYGILRKSGAWFYYDETRLGQGRDAAKRMIADNPELAEELESKIMAAMKEKAKS